jgi:hypothetical protein
LGIADVEAVGHLTSLWHFVLRNAWKDADLSPWGDEGIEMAARWRGKPGAFVKSLRECGYLDEGVAHGWMERAGRLVQERFRNERRKSTASSPPKPGGNMAATEPNRTEPNRKKEGGPEVSIFKLWNERAHKTLPRVKGETEARKTSWRARWKEHPTEGFWTETIDRVNRSPFLLGAVPNAKGWKANIDWLLRPESAIKVQEGMYDAKPGESVPGSEAQKKCARKCGISTFQLVRSKVDQAMICRDCENQEQVRAEA